MAVLNGANTHGASTISGVNDTGSAMTVGDVYVRGGVVGSVVRNAAAGEKVTLEVRPAVEAEYATEPGVSFGLGDTVYEVIGNGTVTPTSGGGTRRIGVASLGAYMNYGGINSSTGACPAAGSLAGKVRVRLD